jgi:hypothetical protein
MQGWSVAELPPCRTDYKSFALVQGAKDRSFVQIYSRTPNPGPEFVQEKKRILGDLGYDVDEIKNTPQVGRRSKVGTAWSTK